MSDDYDSPWKETLDHYFREFMAFYFPTAHSLIDWSVPYVFLEQELAQVARDAELGKRRLDYAGRQRELFVDDNVFALVTVAHLLTQQLKDKPVQRYAAKWKLTRLLYERRWDKQRILDLFAVLDWMLTIPPEMQNELLNNIGNLEKELDMPYMNPFEKRGLEQGREQGRVQGREQGRGEGARQMLETQLEQRFGSLPREASQRLEKATPGELNAWRLPCSARPRSTRCSRSRSR